MPQGIRKILVTTALTYANGPFHLGHLVDNIQADIWVRFQKNARPSMHLYFWQRQPWHTIMIQAEKMGLNQKFS